MKIKMKDHTKTMTEIEKIKEGIADKLSKDNITVYKVKNIIRIDIKE